VKIIITEKQYTQLNQVIQEQGFGGAAGLIGTPQQATTPKDNGFPCLGARNLAPFVVYVQETDYNLSASATVESLIDAFDNTFLFRSLKRSGKLGSVGPAQFTHGTWNKLNMEKRFGMNRDDMRKITGAGLGTIVLLLTNYRVALSSGYSKDTRSVNPFLTKKGTNFKSTNNAALDMAIVSHNMNIIEKYCYTSNPTLAGPCKNPTYDPYKKGSSAYQKYGTLKVYQNKPIKNYFPNKKFGKQTAIGYLEEVIGVMNSLNCVKI
jgi:hypothetical protein